MEFVILYVALSCLAGWIASRKGRCVACWAICTLVFGLIPLILVALFPPIKAVQP